MEYVYAAMMLHSAEKEIDEKSVGAVLKAAGVDADEARVKALVASLASVDIGEAMSQASRHQPLLLRPLLLVVHPMRRLLKKHPLRKKKKMMAQASKAWAHSSDDLTEFNHSTNQDNLPTTVGRPVRKPVV